MIKLTEAELDELFLALQVKRFAVVGDFCLDAYYFLDESRSERSIETGLQTEAVKTARFTPGGAGNTAANLASIGARYVHGFGVVGDDLFGRGYLDLLSSAGINVEDMIVQKKNWHTCVYTKRYEGSREKPRIDIGNFNQLEEESTVHLLNNLAGLLDIIDIVIINQQLVNGVHTKPFREKLQSLISAYPEKTFLLDSRDFTNEYQGTIRKLNDREAVLAAGIESDQDDFKDLETARRAARILSRRWDGPVFVTRGERGSLVQENDQTHVIPGLHHLSPLDAVGAGDSILAGLAAGLAANYAYDKALLFASYVAGVTVTKLFQTGTASREEVRSLAENAQFNLNPEKAASIRTAAYHPDSEIELINNPVKRKIAYAIFDHDGTISTLRQGWESVMEPVMIKAVLGGAYDNVNEGVFERVTAEVRECIDKTTGMQTLLQMFELIKLIRNHGFVPDEKVLTPGEYKKIYLKALNEIIQRRMSKITRGETDASDYTVKGAPEFLKRLKDAGIKLFLASGTDEDDVRREAAFLGYADLFDGGIFGAAESVVNEPKKKVLQVILNEIGPQEAHRIATFGDGPVEMRETWKTGGLCVGVASDEIRRFGLNTEKRKRLILAGADVIIPDFSQAEKLAELILNNAVE